MTDSSGRIEIITSIQHRRPLSAAEKVRMVEETFEPGVTVKLLSKLILSQRLV
jgi:transposase-like protein